MGRTLTAFYNELDPYPAAWLRNLIAAGHIAAGVVDQRSVADLDPKDLEDFAQCHFFAGIGVWSRALRLAGVSDLAPVWTGSCPCQPLSDAGKRRGAADARHLWPAWFRLIRVRRPAAIFGEQVASRAGLEWFDAVRADLEAEGYAVAAADLCAAGVGAPHIRQRIFFVAVASGAERRQGRAGWDGAAGAGAYAEPSGPGKSSLVDDPERARLEGFAGDGRDGDQPGRLDALEDRPAPTAGPSGGLADAGSERRQNGRGWPSAHEEAHGRARRERGEPDGDHEPGRDGEAGFWARCDWLPCRDGKARPVEPGTFPLAHGVAARVGRLRAYGNAIVAQAAAEFVKAAMEVLP